MARCAALWRKLGRRHILGEFEPAISGDSAAQPVGDGAKRRSTVRLPVPLIRSTPREGDFLRLLNRLANQTHRHGETGEKDQMLSLFGFLTGTVCTGLVGAGRW